MILSRQSRRISASVTTEAQLLNYFQPFQFKLFLEPDWKTSWKKSFLFNFFLFHRMRPKKFYDQFQLRRIWNGGPGGRSELSLTDAWVRILLGAVILLFAIGLSSLVLVRDNQWMTSELRIQDSRHANENGTGHDDGLVVSRDNLRSRGPGFESSNLRGHFKFCGRETVWQICILATGSQLE